MNESDLLSDETLDLNIPCDLPVHETWKSVHSDYFASLSEKEVFYRPDPKCFQKQIEINPSMRSMLLDWIMEVCTAFTFKRETYYIALSTLDRFISIILATKAELQLIGLSCLYIACKREEITSPSINDFAKTADNSFTTQEIRIMENKILFTLKWQLCPVTFYTWLNAMLEEWDKFIMFVFNEFVQSMDSEKISKVLVTFKQKNLESYVRFNECVQLLDVCTLDFNVHRFFPVKIVSAIVYLMVNRGFALNGYELIRNAEANDDNFECSVIIDGLLQQFLMLCVGIHSIESLIPPIQFVESFKQFPFTIEKTRFSLVSSYVKNI